MQILHLLPLLATSFLSLLNAGQSLSISKNFSHVKLSSPVAHERRYSRLMSMHLMPQPAVIKSSFRAVAELLTCCGFGSMASKIGVLSTANVTALSQMVYNMFLPCLLLINIVETSMQQSFTSLFPIPLIACSQILLGYFASSMLMKVFGIDSDSEDGAEVKVCSTFGNSAILPLLFASALFRGNSDPTILRKAIAYVSFFLMGWSPTFWTFAQNILVRNDFDKSVQSKNSIDKTSEVNANLFNEPSTYKTADGKKYNVISALKLAMKSPAFARIFSPPIVACLIGITVGMCSSLKHLLVPNDAHLSFVWNSLKVLSMAYTPCGLLILAGSLANAPQDKMPWKKIAKKVGIVTLVRWLLLPAFTIAFSSMLVRRGILPNDAVLLFVLIMEASMPPAQNSTIILQVCGMTNFAGRMAKSLLIYYLVGVIPVSLWLSVALQLCGL